MATNKVARYLGSNRNLAGCAAGLAGLVLHFLGLAGAFWLVVVAGLYLAGALVTPPDRVRLVGDPYAEAFRLRGQFDTVLATAEQHTGRIPRAARKRLREIDRTLENLLARPQEVVARREDLLVDLQRLIQTDLPTAVQTYLNMPWWFAAAKHVSAERTASEELTRQLDLLAGEARTIADRFHRHDLNQQSDHGGYLDER